jgi:agmatinase
MELVKKTFGRFPASGKSGNPRIMIVGIHWAGKNFRSSGQKDAPDYLRDYSQRYFFDRVDPFDAGTGAKISRERVADMGNIRLRSGKPSAAITDEIKKIIGNDAVPLIMGGDHSISYPVLRSYEKFKRIILINFDAHLDYKEEDEIRGDTVMYNISKLDNVACILNIGTRGVVAEKHFKLAKRNRKIKILARLENIDKTLAELAKKIRPDGVYISLDIDALDPSIAPGTAYAEPGGLTYGQVKMIMESIAKKFKMIGMDVVEVNPALDFGNLTAGSAVRVMMDFIFMESKYEKSRH